jgi:hypothetical protein
MIALRVVVDVCLCSRLFSTSYVRRIETNPPLTQFTEDEVMMRESGSSYCSKTCLIS